MLNVEMHGRASLPETNEKMNIQEVDIRTLLPQQAPMVMVDRLVSADEKTAETALEVCEDNLFVEDGVLKPYALVEVMAQSCAAQLGYADKYIHGRNDVRIGYIGSVKKMQVDTASRVGETLTTRVQMLENFGDMRMAVAECFIEERRIAIAELVITLAEERTNS